MDLFKLHLTQCEQAFYRNLKDFGGQSCIHRETSVHQGIWTPLNYHVVCHWQCGREVLLDEEVEDLIRVGSWSIEDVLSKRFGRDQALEVLWVCIANDVEHLRPDTGYLILCRDLEERRECGEIECFVRFGESVGG